MTGISSIACRWRSWLALTLACGILLGFSAVALSQPGIRRTPAKSSDTDQSDAGLPDAPLPREETEMASQVAGATQAGQAPTGQAPTAVPNTVPGNAPVLAQGPGVAQASAFGTIQGLVTDRDGVPYQGVRVTLTVSGAAASGPASIPDVRTTMTDGQGRFQFRSVAAGPFQVSVSSDGFATQIRTGTLNSGENLEEPAIALLIAATSSEVEVTASRHDIAQAQLQQEEQQRVLGVIPNFFVVYAPNAPPLSTGQKFHLAFRYAVDPVSFAAAAVFAGIEQEDNDFQGYGQGAAGYAKRFGAVYGDSFIGGMLGSAIFPSLFKQDPRYFYKGVGSKKSRALYAIESSVLCRGDNGKRQFNYSGVLGGLGGAGISNLYYPAADRNGAGLTFENAGIGIATGAVQNLFQEFVVRHLTPKVPDYGSPKP